MNRDSSVNQSQEEKYLHTFSMIYSFVFSISISIDDDDDDDVWKRII